MMNILGKISKILSHELDKLGEIIKENTFSQVDLLNQIVKHMQKMNGKRVRILLILLIARIYNCNDINISKIAVAIEFIHNATLLHDDVIDNNMGKRRGVNTANKIWNNKLCVLSGDFLLSKSFDLISQVNNMEVSTLLSKSSATIIEGEINQIIFNKSDDLKYEQYLKIIEAKTAELFSTATSAGAILSGLSNFETENLSNFGKYLGIAFQIIDDGLDYFGTNRTLGKPIGTDYREKKMTLPTILLREKLFKDGKESVWKEGIWVDAKFSRESLKNIISYMKEYSIYDDVHVYAEKYISLAKKSIEFMSDKGSFHELLTELTDFVLIRNV